MQDAPRLRVTLASVGNIDHGQNPFRPLPGVEDRQVECRDLAEASRLCREFIETNEIGGGSWNGGLIIDATGVEVGRVSYNGRVWSPGNWHPGMQPLYPVPASDHREPCGNIARR